MVVDDCRDFTGRLAFSLANPQLQAQMRTHIQQHVDEWPYKVCGVVPGVKAKAPKGGSKAVTPTKSSGGITPSVAPKQQPQSQKKKKGSKKGKSGPKTTTGTTSREVTLYLHMDGGVKAVVTRVYIHTIVW